MLTQLVNTLFDEIKRQHGLRSDAALARHLTAETGEKVSLMAILRWRRGEYPHGLKILGPALVEHADTLRNLAA